MLHTLTRRRTPPTEYEFLGWRRELQTTHFEKGPILASLAHTSPHGVKDKRIKVVYVLRNPKDVLVSLYHFAHSWVVLEIPQSFEDFFHQFPDGNGPQGGSCEGFFAFLGKDLTDEAIDHVVEMSTFKNMKTNSKANYKDLLETHRYKSETMRKGVVGDWKNFFTVAQNEHFDKVFNEKMSNLPLTFTWEIKQ